MEKRTIDANGDGKPERIEVYGEGRLVRVELDENADGVIDLWNFFDPEKRLEKQEQDTDHDGRLDTWVVLEPATGRELRVLKDTNADGKADTWRTNDAAGSTVKLEEDKDSDGEPDRTVEFADGRPVRFNEDANRDATRGAR
jgi:hypothetical protein